MADYAVDIAAARQAFADEILNCQYEGQAIGEKQPCIVIRADAELGDAAVLHCTWPLVEKGPHSGTRSREITVQIKASAMNDFRAADARPRGAMLRKFAYIFNTRLLDGQYNEQDPSPPVFKIEIDEHSLAP